MAIKGPQEYLSRLRSRARDLDIYVAGERVEDPASHPVTRPSVEVMLKTYELTSDPRYRGVLTARGLRGDEVSRLVHVESSVEDLIMRAEAQRILNFHIGNCNYRCTGHDGINALFAATYDIDSKHGTDYHARFVRWLEYVQENDLVVETAMTDVKGDRSKRPAEQRGNDMAYVHVVEERDDGIVVRGAKMHVTGAAVADELLVVPTRALREDEREFAVAFAVRPDTKGVHFVASWHPMDAMRKVMRDLGVEIDYPLPFGHRNNYVVIFDDVFVPRERVFMNGEYEFAGRLVEYFTAHHRAAGGPCKAAFADVILGAAALAADTNGVLGASYIQDRLLEIMRHGEAAYAAGLAAMVKAYRHPSGEYIPDPRLANVAKLEAVEHLKEAIVAAADVGGGISVNAPSEADLRVKGVGDELRRALQANQAYSAEDRLRAARLLQVWVAGPHLVGLVQGGGPPAAELLALRADLRSRLGELVDNARRLAGVKGGQATRQGA